MNAVATLTHFRDINLQFTPTSFEELSWIYWRKGKLKDKKKNKFEKTPIGKNGLSKEWQKSYQHRAQIMSMPPQIQRLESALISICQPIKCKGSHHAPFH